MDFDVIYEPDAEFDPEKEERFALVKGEPGGHYTPVFEQVDDEHVRVSFVPSSKALPEVTETVIELPKGPKGDGYILSDADKTEIAEEAAELIEVGEFRETDPTVPSWAKQPNKPTYNATEVGADPAGTAEAKVSEHNTESKAHNDIRLLIAALEARVNGIFDSEDVDLDQVSEIVAFIKSNRSLIEKVTTDKVNITDIIDDLTTSAANKPLSAKQGVQLKSLIDVLTTAFNNHGADTVSHVTSEEKQAWNNKSNFSGAYKDLTGKPNIPSKPEDIGAQPVGNYLTAETDPTVPDWAKQPNKPTYNATEVGADPAGTAGNAVSAHNTNTEAHNDMRLQLQALTDRLNAFFDSDDTTLDELSEIVTYIKSNKTLIDSITTSKVNVSDIIDNLITNVANKPLSAAQGVVLKGLIDALNTAKLDTSKLQEAIDTALAQAKASGEFDGADGVRGKSMLRITTAPSAYTTETGGFTPAYRIALSTVLSQSGATEVMVGDTILRNYYTYPVGYVDASYVYIGKYASIRGSAGTSVTITEITESTEPGGENTVTFSDEKTLTVKNGENGAPGVSPTVSISKSGTVTTITITDESGPKTVKLNDGKDYVLTDADRSAIAALVKPLLKTETWTFELEDGSVVTKDVMLA